MDKRKQLLNAALKLFVEYGFHGTPTHKIALEAGVANGTLFHYFATKDELIIVLYLDIKTRMTAYIFESAKEQTTFKDTMRAQFVASMYWALENTLEFRFIEQFKNSPYLSRIAPKEIENSIKYFCNILTSGIEQNIIKAHPVDLLFALISSHTYGLNQYLITNDFTKARQHQVITESFDMLWAMLT